MSKLADLLAQKATLDQLIADTQRAERADAVAQVKTLMAQYGLSAADLSARAAPRSKPTKSASKVAVKYRNAATGDSWTGRGLQPRWLKAAIAGGRTLQDFSV